jgi:hypothetical protein
MFRISTRSLFDAADLVPSRREFINDSLSRGFGVFDYSIQIIYDPLKVFELLPLVVDGVDYCLMFFSFLGTDFHRLLAIPVRVNFPVIEDHLLLKVYFIDAAIDRGRRVRFCKQERKSICVHMIFQFVLRRFGQLSISSFVYAESREGSIKVFWDYTKKRLDNFIDVEGAKSKNKPFHGGNNSAPRSLVKV